MVGALCSYARWGRRCSCRWPGARCPFKVADLLAGGGLLAWGTVTGCKAGSAADVEQIMPSRMPLLI
jgi:hypothetical protein